MYRPQSYVEGDDGRLPCFAVVLYGIFGGETHGALMDFPPLGQRVSNRSTGANNSLASHRSCFEYEQQYSTHTSLLV